MQIVRPTLLMIVFAAVALVGSVAAIGNDYFIDKNQSCFASTKEPRRPMPLEFCYWMNDNSCCTPGNDAAALSAFYGIVTTGTGCSPSEHNVRATNNEIRDLMCLPCDPREPQYRFLASVGDAITPADPTAPADQFVWRICASFLYGYDDKSGLWGGDGTKFDRCGLTLTTNDTAALAFPSTEFGAGAPDQRTAADQLFSVLLANMWIPDFHYVVVNDSATDFNPAVTPCFRGSNGAAGHATQLALFLSVILVCFGMSM